MITENLYNEQQLHLSYIFHLFDNKNKDFCGIKRDYFKKSK